MNANKEYTDLMSNLAAANLMVWVIKLIMVLATLLTAYKIAALFA